MLPQAGGGGKEKNAPFASGEIPKANGALLCGFGPLDRY